MCDVACVLFMCMLLQGYGVTEDHARAFEIMTTLVRHHKHPPAIHYIAALRDAQDGEE